MANFCTLNPLAKYSGLTLSNGNLTVTQGVDGRSRSCLATAAMPSSGKFYFEVICNKRGLGVNNGGVQWGLTKPTSLWWDSASSQGVNRVGISVNGNDGNSQYLNSVDVVGYIPKTAENAIVDSDIMMLAYDADTGKVWLGKNGVWGNNGGIGNPAAGTNPARTLPTTETWIPAVSCGTDSGSTQLTVNFGQNPWFFTPPTGFVGLSTENLAEPTISNLVDENPEDHFGIMTWTGTGSYPLTVNTLSFDPDFIWLKDRDSTGFHRIFDRVRGATSSPSMYSNSTTAEQADNLSFISNGFSYSSDPYGGGVNISANRHVAWCFKAGGTPVSNTDGQTTSLVSANTKAGFSIIKYTGTGVSNNFGHGLNQTPELFIIKCMNRADEWVVYPYGITQNSNWLRLQTSDTYQSDAVLETVNDTVIQLGSSGARNNSGDDYICYAWHSVPGFSKIVSWTGNGLVDGPYIECGFRPAYILYKNVSAARTWNVIDAARNPYNPVTQHLHPNLSNAEAAAPVSTPWCDFTANGFKIRCTYNEINVNNENYIALVIAESPFKYSTAR